MPSSRSRELLLNLVLAGVSLALGAAAFELAVRAFAPQTVLTLQGLYIPDPQVGFRHAPGYRGRERNAEYDVRVLTDPRGYRVPAATPSPGPGAFRIVGLGDSFTYGAGVEAEEVYLARLEARLRELGEDVAVINAGVGGMGLDNEARLLEADGDALRPDLVIVGFYVGNDLRDVMCGYDRFVVDADGFRHWKDGILQRFDHPLRPGRIVRDGSVPERAGIRSTGALPIPFKDILRRKLHSYVFLQRRYDALRARLRETPEAAKQFTVFHDQAAMLVAYPPELEGAWAEVDRLVGRMAAWTGARGARLAIVAIPTGEQVYPGMWQHAQTLYGLDAADFDLDKPQRRLAAIGAGHGVPVLDLRDALSATATAGGVALYFRRDIHWTPAGHDAAAAEVARWLLEQDLLATAAAPPEAG